MNKYKCPCCEHFTLEKGNGNFEICPVCFWEDDPIQRVNRYIAGGANRVSLELARTSYSIFGYSDVNYASLVRPPKEDEKI